MTIDEVLELALEPVPAVARRLSGAEPGPR